MCDSHYVMWLVKMKKSGLKKPLERPDARMLAAMPGTYEQISEVTGNGPQWTQKIVRELHQSGKAHISDYLPPQNIRGSRWIPIFSAGKGKDAVVTEQQKKDHMLARRRELYEKSHGKTYRKPFSVDPLLGHFFGAARPSSDAAHG